MEKQINFAIHGHRADVGEYTIYRLLPNRFFDAVGPFVFLDHAAPVVHEPDGPLKKANGSGAHPHRGIATLTYVLSGEADHFDSAGHHAKVYSGGAQWMKAGTGIIHDESMNPDPETQDYTTHALQFWVNLPSKNKAEEPQYIPVQANEVSRMELADSSGWMRVISGEYGTMKSKIPTYLKQFIYHVHLEAGKELVLDIEKGLELAVFLPLNKAIINENQYPEGQFLYFDQEAGSVKMKSLSDSATDIILFGGLHYDEPIAAQGPFVMNTMEEIGVAYNDFYAGKYGKINYSVE
ncbi:pirin family protein [Chryseobacterium lactis]|uniref:Pirin family protein n=1 Tax=Chryseobacterium lactis TaxID=1241981 RepID=A0A3G6RRN6_CHRLC|nr:pirin family protein [Chryseobacterium lactis]AZA84316.1 pirin family protein [Chryseobacterium lactis]AZB04704.1 pirin family protein [Chryseobacterium lactis]PNW14435.1 pirin family protein [Chryseobacterium lactis]